VGSYTGSPVKQAPWSWFLLGPFNPILLPVESLVMLAFAFVSFADGQSSRCEDVALRPSGISPTLMKRVVSVPSEARMPTGEALRKPGDLLSAAAFPERAVGALEQRLVLVNCKCS
jgi:hypothetical protein